MIFFSDRQVNNIVCGKGITFRFSFLLQKWFVLVIYKKGLCSPYYLLNCENTYKHIIFVDGFIEEIKYLMNLF